MEGTQPSPSRRPHARDAQPGRPTSCLGMLYYSQSRYERQKEPVRATPPRLGSQPSQPPRKCPCSASWHPQVCAGVRRWHAANRGAGELPTEAIPGGDFKYVCLGYSAYDTAKLKAEAAQRTGSSDGVHVPYCEGLEVRRQRAAAAARLRRPQHSRLQTWPAGQPRAVRGATPVGHLRGSNERQAGAADERS